MLLVGIIPGPKEPSLLLNSYLSPLINELKQYYETGLTVLTPFNTHVTLRLALSCVTCDIPATHKLCGFLSHH